MPLRFEAWTLPGSATFEKKFDIPVAMPGSAGVRELSAYADESLLVPASYSRLPELVDSTDGSLIRVYHRDNLIDEFDASRVSLTAGRPNTRTISGLQRNGLVEGIAIAPHNYPEHVVGAMDHIWGGENLLGDLDLGSLGSIREEWEVHHDHTGGTWNADVDGDDNDIDHDASNHEVEGLSETLSPPGTGFQGLTTVDDVAVSGVGSADDPYVIVFFAPPNPGSVTLDGSNLNGGSTFSATQIVAGAIDPDPVTKSQPIDAQAGDPDEHGEYDEPPTEAVTTNLDTGADFTVRVNATARYAGTQRVRSVTPNQTYSDLNVRVDPDTAGDYTIVVRDEFENLIAQNRDVALSSGSYQNLSIDEFTVPAGVSRIIVRVAVTDANPANIDDFYVNWQGATLNEGQPETTYDVMVHTLLGYAQDRDAGDWLEVDTNTGEDSLGTTLSEISFTVFVGNDVHLGTVLDDGRKMGYQWQVVPADDALVITPAAGTTHVLQIYYVNANEIEDLAVAGGPSVTVGGKGVTEAEIVSRRIPYTTLIGLGAGDLSAEDTDSAAESALGRIEKIVDIEHLASAGSLTEYLDAQTAEQALNLKAATAKVTEHASQVPLVDYGPGSQIWWQFPGILDKEARPVKRIGWTHGMTAEFEIQGSRILTGDAAIVAAVDFLLRKAGRRRSRERPTVQLAGGGGAMAHVLIVSESEPEFIRDKADYVVTDSNTATPLQAIYDALEAQQGSNGAWSIWHAGELDLDSDVTAPDDAWIRSLGYTQTEIFE